MAREENRGLLVLTGQDHVRRFVGVERSDDQRPAAVHARGIENRRRKRSVAVAEKDVDAVVHGDDQIGRTVAAEVGRGDLRGVLRNRADDRRTETAASVVQKHGDLVQVAAGHGDVRECVAVEVRDDDLRRARRGKRLRRRERRRTARLCRCVGREQNEKGREQPESFHRAPPRKTALDESDRI